MARTSGKYKEITEEIFRAPSLREALDRLKDYHEAYVQETTNKFEARKKYFAAAAGFCKKVCYTALDKALEVIYDMLEKEEPDKAERIKNRFHSEKARCIVGCIALVADKYRGIERAQKIVEKLVGS